MLIIEESNTLSPTKFRNVDDEFLNWFIDRIHKARNMFVGTNYSRSELKHALLEELRFLSKEVEQMGLGFNVKFNLKDKDDGLELLITINGEEYTIMDLRQIIFTFVRFKLEPEEVSEENTGYRNVIFWNFGNDMHHWRDDAFIQFL